MRIIGRNPSGLSFTLSWLLAGYQRVEAAGGTGIKDTLATGRRLRFCRDRDIGVDSEHRQIGRERTPFRDARFTAARDFEIARCPALRRTHGQILVALP